VPDRPNVNPSSSPEREQEVEHSVTRVFIVWGVCKNDQSRENESVSPLASPGVRPAEREQSDVDESVDLDKPWIVVVWNDPINLMSYVTYVFQKLFGYSLEKATELMLDVHHKGRAVVSSGTREKAEMDVYRLHDHGLWATMEQES
jgi:ATP-dependent Clp protease adaptor protein ClpS